MSVTNANLGKYIVGLLTQRLQQNLKLGFFEDITVQTTRGELRKLTGTTRIEDSSIDKMVMTVSAAGFAVVQSDDRSTFSFTVRVKELLASPKTLTDLSWETQWVSKLVAPKKRVLRPAK